MKALTGLRVIDLSNLLAAPQVSALLGDFGADVLKLEPPGGDPLQGLGVARGGRSVPYSLANRGKRIAEVDLESPAGRELTARLIGAADVVVVNQPKALLQRWELTYEELSVRHPAVGVRLGHLLRSRGPVCGAARKRQPGRSIRRSDPSHRERPTGRRYCPRRRSGIRSWRCRG